MALSDLRPGLTGVLEVTVAPEHTAHASGHAGVHVLATPTLTLFCEEAAGKAIAHAREPGESTVGLHNDIWHLAAAPVGRRVRIEAELVEIDGRKLKFALSGDDGRGNALVRGVHERVWVDLEKFLARVSGGAAG